MATLHEELASAVTMTDGNNIDTVEGFRKDVKKKLSKFLCGVGDLKKEHSESGKRPPLSPSTASTSSTDFAEAKTAFISMESRRGAGDARDVTPDDSDVYNFTYVKRGLAVIINNENFASTSDFDNRPGSSYDASALYHSFAHLGFNVLLYENLAAWKMVEVLKAAARDYDHENADCFACSVLTHGDQTWSDREYDRLGLSVRQDLLFGTDGKAVSTRTVIDLFSDRACPGLEGKPRLFFLQACRGNRLDDGQDLHVVTPIPRGIRGRGGRDVPDNTYSRSSVGDTCRGRQPEPPANQGGQPGDSSLVQRQVSLSSSVDPPGYPKLSDMVDARPAPDDDDDDENNKEESLGGGGGDNQSLSTVQGSNISHVDAGGDEGLVDRSSVPWRKMRVVPVSPAPLYKDCLVMYATPPGHFAWRRKNGAWFIQSLCKVLDSRHLGSLSLARALVQVSGHVARNYQSENPSRPAMHAKKEMPVMESMLVKDVFLRSK